MVFFCSSERTVTIPRSSNGFGFKMIGGKTVGVFISDIRADVTRVSIKHRSCIDHTPTSNREMTLKKGSLLRVVNTFVHAPNYWLAWAVDERTGVETQLKRIPSPV